MKEYYCERFDTDKPYFRNYKAKFASDAEALQFFQRKHGAQLQCVYDEDFKFIFESESKG